MKAGIITICDNNNYGNRLQNYALQHILEKHFNEVITLKNEPYSNTKDKYLLRLIKNISYKGTYSQDLEKRKMFENFNRNIKFSNKKITAYSNLKKFDFVFTGSDQVWNPNIARLREVDVLANVEYKKRIAFSASLGVNEISNKYHKIIKKEISKFKAISVREIAGKNIIEKLTKRDDIKVLVDPTMLLSAKEWDEVAKRPKQLKKDKYILNYFLGKMSEKRKQEIEKIAKENDCEIINILDKNSPFYQTGPSEFLYLEKNAFLICTDSFHSCVFAIIYNRPFVVFDREDNTVSMNSRIETLLNKFMLQDRKYNGKLTEEQLKHNYENAYKILEKEKQKAYNFLNTALDIKENEIERK